MNSSSSFRISITVGHLAFLIKTYSYKKKFVEDPYSNLSKISNKVRSLSAFVVAFSSELPANGLRVLKLLDGAKKGWILPASEPRPDLTEAADSFPDSLPSCPSEY